MSWQILITLSIFLYSSSVLLQRVLLKNNKTDPISFAILFQTGVSLVIGLFVLITKGGINFPNLLPFFWSVVLMTVSYALANIFIFKSLKFTEAGFIPEFSKLTLNFLPEVSSFSGQIVKSMFGITQQMDLMQVLTYSTYVMFMMYWVFIKKSQVINYK